MDPKVTVLLPSYNRAGLLPVALHSVFAQTYSDFELIVVDDGSTDDTASVVRGFPDPRLRYLSQENRGISGALNAGLGLARGVYIARVDSDDRWLPDLLEREVAVLETRPDVGLVYSKAQAMDPQGQPLAQILGAPEKFPGQTLKSILYGDFVCTITAVVRRECLEQAGPFDENLKGNEDWDMWVRLARVCRFAYLDQVLANFRQHTGRTTGGQSPHFVDIAQGRFYLLDKAFSQPDLPPEARSIRPAAYRNAHMDVGLRWLSVGEWRMTLKHFGLALRSGGNPFATLARIVYLIVLYRFLSKHDWGIRLVEGMVRLRRRNQPAPKPKPNG
ncbi:MAG TPA: glycosyltransferase [Anaerolineales bacterium]